jgi:pimeloyl-ACP methyl ester carboxylesterase
MSAIVIDGGIVHYEAFGRGRPVIFIHGWLGSWRYWMPTMEEVARTHRAYALDLWGFGDSDKIIHNYEITDYMTLIAAFMGEMGIRSAPIVGHDLGATIGIELAVTESRRVEKLVAVSLPLQPKAISRQFLISASSPTLTKLFWRRQVAYDEVQLDIAKVAENVMAQSIQSVTRTNILEALSQLTIPTLVIYGEKDNIIDPTYGRKVDGKWPNIRLIGLKDSSHFPMLDEKSKFNRLLQDFLDKDTDLASLELKEEWRRRTR